MELLWRKSVLEKNGLFNYRQRVLEGSAVKMWFSLFKSLKCYFLDISKKSTVFNIYGLHTVVTVFWF